MKDLTGHAIVFLADGMADEPTAELNGKTPLQAVDTPFMDSIAANGASGTFLTLPDGFPTSSDAANMSVLGYDLATFYPGRGPIECTSQGIELAADDVAWRCNLIFVDSNGVLRDYSAGHISADVSSRIMADLAAKFNNEKVSFHNGVSYRNLLVLHGKEFSPAIGFYKPDSSQDRPVAELPWTALDDTVEATYTAAFLEDLVTEAGAFLEEHPLVSSGECAGNAIWPWSPGKTPAFPAFKEKYGKSGAVITAVDVISGIGKCAGMDVIPVPGATGYIDTNYAGKAQAAIRAIVDHDFVYVHLEAIDETSHEGKLELKIKAITDFENKLVKPVMEALKGTGVTFAILPDHPVPIKKRMHTRTPVPFAICGPHIEKDDVTVYSEPAALKGGLGYLTGDQFMRKVMNLD